MNNEWKSLQQGKKDKTATKTMFQILVNKWCKMFKAVEMKFAKYKWVVKEKIYKHLVVKDIYRCYTTKIFCFSRHNIQYLI